MEGAQQPLLGSNYVVFEPHQKDKRVLQQLDFDIELTHCFFDGSHVLIWKQGRPMESRTCHFL